MHATKLKKLRVKLQFNYVKSALKHRPILTLDMIYRIID